jgi:hypothetical protein
LRTGKENLSFSDTRCLHCYVVICPTPKNKNAGSFRKISNRPKKSPKQIETLNKTEKSVEDLRQTKILLWRVFFLLSQKFRSVVTNLRFFGALSGDLIVFIFRCKHKTSLHNLLSQWLFFSCWFSTSDRWLNTDLHEVACLLCPEKDVSSTIHSLIFFGAVPFWVLSGVSRQYFLPSCYSWFNLSLITNKDFLTNNLLQPISVLSKNFGWRNLTIILVLSFSHNSAIHFAFHCIWLNANLVLP